MSDNDKLQPPATPEDAAPGYETSDARARPILVGIVISVLVITFLAVILNEFFVYTRETITQEVVASRMDPELRRLESEALAKLNGYAWVDSSAGVVRIPVDRAMELMADEAYRERRR